MHAANQPAGARAQASAPWLGLPDPHQQPCCPTAPAHLHAADACLPLHTDVGPHPPGLHRGVALHQDVARQQRHLRLVLGAAVKGGEGGGACVCGGGGSGGGMCLAGGWGLGCEGGCGIGGAAAAGASGAIRATPLVTFSAHGSCAGGHLSASLRRSAETRQHAARTRRPCNTSTVFPPTNNTCHPARHFTHPNNQHASNPGIQRCRQPTRSAGTAGGAAGRRCGGRRRERTRCAPRSGSPARPSRWWWSPAGGGKRVVCVRCVWGRRVGFLGQALGG